jgi:hypothetical protein
VLLVRFVPAQSVADEMNAIYTEALRRQSQEQVALARKDVQYILTTAEAERKALLGQGVSLMRRAYLSGMQECLDAFVESFKGAAAGDFVLTWADVLYMQLLLQHFDAQRAMHNSGNSGGGTGSSGGGGAGVLALSTGPQAVHALRDRLTVGHVRTHVRGAREEIAEKAGGTRKSGASAAAGATPTVSSRNRPPPPPRPKVNALEKRAPPKTSQEALRLGSKERKDGAPPRPAGGRPPPSRRPPQASNRPATTAGSRDPSQESVASRGSRASRASAGSL